MQISLEQHLFTSGDPEFITVAKTSGLTSTQVIDMEQHSLYFLPPDLLYAEVQSASLPVKYIFYPLAEDFVIGRAVYAGKDALGRPGNYFFHNFLITGKDFISCGANPIKLIKHLVSHSFFRQSTGEPLSPLSITIDQEEAFDLPDITIPGNQLENILNSLITYSQHNKPVIIKGDDTGLLDLVEVLFALLPYDLRVQMSFDTYAFGTSCAFPISGFPAADVYNQNHSHSVLINLQTKQFQGYETSASADASLVTALYMSADRQAIETIYRLFIQFNTDRGGFKNFTAASGFAVKQGYYSLYKTSIKKAVTEENDFDLFHIFSTFMSLEDFSDIFKYNDIIAKIIIDGRESLLESLVTWIFHQKKPAAHYPLIFIHPALWKIMIKKIKEAVEKGSLEFLSFPMLQLFVDLFTFLKKHYKNEYEEELFYLLLLSESSAPSEPGELKPLCKVIEQIPKTDTLRLLFFRKFFIYKSRNILKDDIFVWDFSLLEEKKQIFVLNFFIDRIARVVSSKLIEKYLGKLYASISDKSCFNNCMMEYINAITVEERDKKNNEQIRLVKRFFQQNQTNGNKM